jgi:hypothetical protein
MIFCVLISTPCRSEKYQAVDDPSSLVKVNGTLERLCNFVFLTLSIGTTCSVMPM